MTRLLLTHICACFFMTGVIWVIQLIHYPAFSLVKQNEFQNFQRDHTKKIAFIVVPMMVIEFLTGAALIFWPPALSLTNLIWQLNVLLILAIWGATFFVSVPLHEALGKGQDHDTVLRLVKTNWFRTGLWTLRAAAFLTIIISN
jgi:hypothetical protein